MSRCADYLELISAYADGELTEPDRRRVEEHLEACGQCSAILGVYREISIAANEACVPAPDALRDGVMEKVLGGGAAGSGAAGSKPRLVRIAIARYLPLAACLAVMLISLPWVISNFRGQTGDTASAPEAAIHLYAPPAASEAAQDSIPAMAGGGPNTFSADIPAPGSEAPITDDSSSITARSGRGAADTGGADADDAGAYGAKATGAEVTGAGADGAVAGGAGAGSAGHGGAEPDAAEPERNGIGVFTEAGDLHRDMSEPPDASLFEDYSVPRSTGDNGDLPAPSDIWASLGGFEDAYAWIELAGGLPELLRTHEPQYLPAGSGFEERYLIPCAVLWELIEEARAADGTDLKVFPINVDGDYAVVLWKPH